MDQGAALPAELSVPFADLVLVDDRGRVAVADPVLVG
jgi:hypothetical protein